VGLEGSMEGNSIGLGYSPKGMSDGWYIVITNAFSVVQRESTHGIVGSILTAM